MDIPLLLTILVAFIGFAVTALLGINIWNSLSIDRRVENKVKMSTDSLKKDNKELKEQLIHYSKAIACKSMGDHWFRLTANVDAFYYYLESLDYSYDTGEKDLFSEVLDRCIEIMEKSADNVISDERTIRNLDDIKRIMVKINDDRAFRLYSYFSSLSDPSRSGN